MGSPESLTAVHSSPPTWTEPCGSSVVVTTATWPMIGVVELRSSDASFRARATSFATNSMSPKIAAAIPPSRK